MTAEIVFIELDQDFVSDKAHCGECVFLPWPTASEPSGGAEPSEDE